MSWTNLITFFYFLRGFGFFWILITSVVSLMWMHLLEQIKNPWDAGNAWIIAQYSLFLLAFGVCCRLGWIVISMYVRSAILDMIVIGRYFLMVRP